MPLSVAILGAGSWGTALAIHLTLKELPVTLWAVLRKKPRKSAAKK